MSEELTVQTKLVDGTVGDFNTLRIDTVDEQDIPLVWTLKFTDDGFVKTEYWEATGTDEKIYTINVSAPPIKTGAVTVEAKV